MGSGVGGGRTYLDIVSKDLYNMLLRQGGMLSEEPVVTQVLKHWLIVLGGITTSKDHQRKKRNVKGN